MRRNKGARRSSMAKELCSSRPRWHVSVRRGNGGQQRARRDPFLIGLEREAEPVIKHSEGAIAIAHYSFRHRCLHFLRNHADIGTIAAVVAEAVIAKPVRQMAEENKIVLEHDIGSPATAAAATATPAATSAESAATSATETAATAAAHSHAATGPGETLTAARGMTLSCSSGADVAQCVAASSTRRPLRSTFGAGLAAGRPLSRAGPPTRGPLPRAGP